MPKDLQLQTIKSTFNLLLSDATGHQNALKDGFFARSDLPPNPSIDAVIEDLFHRYLRLGAYVEQRCQSGHPSPRELIDPFTVHGQAATKRRRLLLNRRELREREALDELSQELEVEL